METNGSIQQNPVGSQQLIIDPPKKQKTEYKLIEFDVYNHMSLKIVFI